MFPARLWEKGAEGKVRCLLCARGCAPREGERGFCQVRINRGGEFFSLNYGYAEALSLDPVEKKPLYHFWPGTATFSVGAPGCDFDCLGCQNFTLSRPGTDYPGPARVISPEDVVEMGLETGARSLSFTYSEPTVFYEFAVDAGDIAREKGLPSIWVTNGFLSAAAFDGLGSVAAMNIDLKGFTEKFYLEVAHGRLGPVLDSIREAWRRGIWLEVTTLLIPGLNDGREELEKLVAFLVSVSPDIPWHVSAFAPLRKQADLRRTSPRDLERAREIGRAGGLNYVYLGNAVGPGYGDTVCPQCRALLIERRGYETRLALPLAEGACPSCGQKIPGVWA
ncbi:MAG: AmmeMemoRadiSam system radical SAM enzyme [Deltaproteobacteria bacterium]|jgi:pyruvate formate lyase activating enzyme|nr:AmmeMemoRadiSam system radical SAM enzyme [Deltaproteobacteria bacterium]